MSILKRLSLGVLTTLAFASVVSASSFRAADIIYLPAVARAAGAGGSFFKTDVTISNVSSSPVIVSIAYAPTGGGDNSGVTNTLVNLPVLQPGERREIVDIASSVLNRGGDGVVTNGYLIFFACRQGGNCSNCDTNSGDCLLITVQGRIYNSKSDGSSFGQSFPGIPWYNYVAVTSSDRGLDKVFIAGLRNSGSPGVSGFRSNIGIVNASQFSKTVIRVKLFNNTGTQLGSIDQTLEPLGHIQFPATNISSTFSGDGFVTLEQVSVTPAPGQTDSNPGFMAYGSLLDNITSDPTTLEATYNVVMPFDCIYGSKPQKRLVKRQ